MLPSTFATPSRLAIFALEQGSGLPIARMPAYAEVIVRSEEAAPPVDPFLGLDDPILAALRADAPENLGDPQPRRRLLDAINRELVRQLGSKGLARLSEVPGALPKFVAAVIQRIRGAANNAPLQRIDGDALVIALKSAIREEAARQKIPLEPPFVGAPTLWAYSLGVLATDHVGYLSYDLSRLPLTVRKALSAAINAKSLDPAATLDVTVAVYPTGPGGAFFDALAQGRVTQEAIVSRFEIARLHLPDAIQNLALPAMQSPSLEDWRLSPGSFATNPGSLIGADGCESILPANLSLQEQYFYQVVRLRDVSVPVAPVVAQQVQLGIVNEYRVAWNPLGHSLGQIIYSMPLAPGESVNLAVIDWTRRDEAQRTERTTVDEQLVHNEHRDRTISEAVTAAAREYQHGSSFAAGVSGALGSTSGGTGAGIAGSLGGSSSSSSGSRDISGNTIQKLSDNITQASSSMRELQSTVVVHSTQSEKEAIETRTIVNYNHSHALTILYYEVLRHFRVVTEFVRQRPAVFVKIKTDWFETPNGSLRSIFDNRAVLTAALLDARLAPAFDALDRVVEGRYNDLSKPFPNQPVVVVDPNPPPRFHFFTFEMRCGGFVRNVDDDDQHADVLAHLLLKDGSAVTLIDNSGSDILNHSGAFRMNGQNNVFTATLAGNGEISWENIRGIGLHVAVFPSDESNAQVSFSHIKVTGLDLAGPPGVVLVDEAHDDGHIVIRHQDIEKPHNLILPTKRPGPAASPAPIVTGNEGADRAQVLELIAHLKSNKRHYSRAIALSVGALERGDALDTIAMSDGSTVLDHIENRPLEIVGDFLAYPSTDRNWNRAITTKIDAAFDGESDFIPPDERLVALPTRGVFAEAKLGHCNASEQIDNTRFWDWQQSPIPHFAPEIAPTVPVTPQPQQQNLSATPFPTSIVNIVNPPAAPDPTGLAAAFNVLGTPNLFRDMSGTALTVDLLKNLTDNAVKIAAVAGGSRAGQSGSGSGGSGSTGGGGGIGGPRATATQPSASNRDLQDFGNVVGRLQEQGLVSPEAARKSVESALAGVTGQPAGAADALAASDLPAGEFIPFVDAKRLHPRVAAVLSGFMSAPLDSWRHMIARFVLTELSANRLSGIVLDSQATDIRSTFINTAADPQPGGVSAGAFFDANSTIGGAIAASIGATAKNGGRVGFILVAPPGLDGSARITRNSNGTSVAVSLEETLVHELTHFRNQSNQQTLLAFPDSAASIYVDPALAAARTAANSANAQAATVQVLRRFTEEITARHIHWRVRTEIGVVPVLNNSIQPAQLGIAALEYFVELSGVFAPVANGYVQEINRRGAVAQLNQVAMWLNVCAFYAFSDKPEQDGDSRQLFRLAAAWAAAEAAKSAPLADLPEAQGLAPLLRDFQ